AFGLRRVGFGLSYGTIDHQGSPRPQAVAFEPIPSAQLICRDPEIVGYGKHRIAAPNLVTRGPRGEVHGPNSTGKILSGSDRNNEFCVRSDFVGGQSVDFADRFRRGPVLAGDAGQIFPGADFVISPPNALAYRNCGNGSVVFLGAALGQL